ncbi:hypothetical protein ACPX19_11525 [Winogradskyella sp. HB-48]|uniref:hypothetical protein n=1 Tax=Winogradskyella sp. HB-48 TaxID=3416808 RepID=UPI003CF363E3
MAKPFDLRCKVSSFKIYFEFDNAQDRPPKKPFAVRGNYKVSFALVLRKLSL